MLLPLQSYENGGHHGNHPPLREGFLLQAQSVRQPRHTLSVLHLFPALPTLLVTGSVGPDYSVSLTSTMKAKTVPVLTRDCIPLAVWVWGEQALEYLSD